jgi:L-fuculose-phosphate aldolase
VSPVRSVDGAAEKVLAAAKEMLAKGLVEGTAGNISARQADGTVVITPSSVDYAAMTLDDLVVIDAGGEIVSASEGRSPSSEKPLHLACYEGFDDIGAVIHSHAVHATMFAVARQAIQACIDEFSIYVGGDVRVSEYAASGTDAMAANVVAALRDRGAALIANHGMVAVGPTPGAALHITALVERSAKIVWGARQLGPVHELPADVNANFASVYRYLRDNAT